MTALWYLGVLLLVSYASAVTSNDAKVAKKAAVVDLTSSIRRLGAIEKHLGTLVNEVTAIKDRQESIERNLKESPHAVPENEQMAFLAVHIEDQSVTKENLIHFPNVIYNKGDGYKPNNHWFICAVTGTYLFSFTIPHSSTSVETKYVFTKETLSGYSTITGAFAFTAQSVSKTIVVDCKNNEAVAVRNGGTQTVTIRSEVPGLLSFTGVRLY